MKEIKQKVFRGITIHDAGIGLVCIEQFGKPLIDVERENTRELALSICPELAEEIERLKAQHFNALVVIKKHNLEEEYINLRITH